ncbi:hypothetical protein FRC01_002168 [Tulasnella sp. 417]|nr:hypothetical protein FRC01_002168 [Tulasnella sp. 417]
MGCVESQSGPVNVARGILSTWEGFKQTGGDTSRSQIDDLPPELFQPILESAVPKGEKTYYLHLLPKRQVSKRWLAFIDSCPSMWSYVYLGLNARLLQMILQHSGEHLLDVEFDDEAVSEETLDAFFEHITQHRRWTSLSFKGRSSLDLSQFLTKQVPNLRKLTVDVTPMQNTYLMWPAAIAAPLLAEVKLHHCGLKWDSLRGLRRLEIYGGGPCAEDLAEILTASPAIENLTLINNWKMHNDAPNTSQIHLSNLRTLVIKRSGTSASLLWLFRSMTAPRLEDLTVQPQPEGPFSTLSELLNLFPSIGVHAGSCAAKTRPSELKIRAMTTGLTLGLGRSSITATTVKKDTPSNEWVELAVAFVQSLPSEARDGLTTLRIQALKSERGLAMLTRLLPILPWVRIVGVEYANKEEDHGSLTAVLKERLEMEDTGRRYGHVYLTGGRLMRQDKESLENLVVGLYLENVNVVDEAI